MSWQAVLEQVSGEGLAQRMTARLLVDARAQDRIAHGALSTVA